MLSYIKLKFSCPNLPRPYESPLGILGATIGSILAIFALIACYFIPAYQPGIKGIALVLIVGTFYFFLCSTNQLVAQAPEEAAALKNSKFKIYP
ncbi:MAG: hypothetical protein KME46_06715 [Brasilonema angustatum HA4187-MV1]|jgi:ethanolamine permease|nr:hypothetical protein [Brasilonema angustatum HA4187-MV1]